MDEPIRAEVCCEQRVAFPFLIDMDSLRFSGGESAVEPDVLETLQREFGLMSTSEPEADLQAMLG